MTPKVEYYCKVARMAKNLNSDSPEYDDALDQLDSIWSSLSKAEVIELEKELVENRNAYVD